MTINAMWGLRGSQEILLDLFSKGARPNLLDTVAEVSPILVDRSDVLLVWSERPRTPEPPECIVVDPRTSRELLAWAGTVIGTHRPLSAFVRILSKEYAHLALRSFRPSLGRLEAPVIGLILGEAMALSGQTRASSLGVLACESTLSFSYGRALALGYYEESGVTDPVWPNWSHARRLTRQAPRRLNDTDIGTGVQALARVASRRAPNIEGSLSPFIAEACLELLHDGAVKRSWSLLAPQLGDVGALASAGAGTREKRVQLFEQVLHSSLNLDPVTSAFVTGLLADNIAPGSFEHADLLGRPSVPHMALLWYGLCAGLNPDSEAHQIGSCLGRRLIRDLVATESLMSTPRCDINFDELTVYLDRDSPLDLRVGGQSHMTIELAPGVPAIVKWPPGEAGTPADTTQAAKMPAQPTRQAPLFPSDQEEGTLWREAHNTLADFDRQTVRLRDILTAIEHPKGGKHRRRRR